MLGALRFRSRRTHRTNEIESARDQLILPRRSAFSVNPLRLPRLTRRRESDTAALDANGIEIVTEASSPLLPERIVPLPGRLLDPRSTTTGR